MSLKKKASQGKEKEIREQIQVFNGHHDWVHAVEYSPFVIKDSTGSSNVICSGSDDNTIRFWDIRSNKDQLYVIEGDENEDDGIFCLKFIVLKKKDQTKNVTHDLNLRYDVFYLTLLFKKFKKLHEMFFKNSKTLQMKMVSKSQDILGIAFSSLQITTNFFCIVSNTQNSM
ncbi:hypothetical protein RFI_04137 [Reticulomyxa filosa]|uniref:Uncharacterized protein n=1 Tax=Reticulomyxa filosa TaxID=46433 RepID=X6P438_RETFI|nr:hypothetical protein RFI_04137 [Reticulomyxa filosa]|eukprot:ETO32971.1 hypothetical protein RFI_04137 [Reticulomyxa filosa]